MNVALFHPDHRDEVRKWLESQHTDWCPLRSYIFSLYNSDKIGDLQTESMYSKMLSLLFTDMSVECRITWTYSYKILEKL